MELFLPSLFVLSLSALIVFLVLPRFSPFIIFVLCSVFLVIASYIHFSMYTNEYRNLMFFDLEKTGPVFLIVAISLGIFFASSNLLRGFKFSIPKISLSDSKPTNFTNIPFSKIKELEAQV